MKCSIMLHLSESALFAKIKQSSVREMHGNLESSTCDPFKYTMGSPILNVSICVGKSIRIQRVKGCIVLKLKKK